VDLSGDALAGGVDGEAEAPRAALRGIEEIHIRTSPKIDEI
jgi:hypothetical protein